jgi:uncharacterized membrane protein (DUF485 family)
MQMHIAYNTEFTMDACRVSRVAKKSKFFEFPRYWKKRDAFSTLLGITFFKLYRIFWVMAHFVAQKIS